MPIDKKFGRIRPAILPHHNMRVAQFTAVALKAPPAAATWVKDWPGILGDNDKIGSCGPTALANLIKCQSMNATGTPVILTTDQIVTFYSAVSGYDPSKTSPITGANPTDEGVNLEDMLNKAMAIGIGGHKVLGFAAIDPKNTNARRWGSIMCSGLLCGSNLQQAQINQTDENEAWAYVRSSPVVGGHATVDYGYEAEAGDPDPEDDGESWATKTKVKVSFLTNCLEELYAVLTDAAFNAQGLTPSGLTQAQILANFEWFTDNA